MDKKSFILHLDSLSVLDELTDAQAGKLFKAIKAYHLRDAERCYQDGETGFEHLMEDFLTRIVFAPFKAQFERDRDVYSEISQRRSESGRKGGAPPGNKNAEKQPKQANACKNKQNNLSDSVSESDNDSEREIPLPPLKDDFVFEKELSDCLEELQMDVSWKEALCMNTRIQFPAFSPKDLDKFLLDFFRKLQNEGIENKAFNDAKCHFARWLKIELKNSYGIDKQQKKCKSREESTRELVDRFDQGTSLTDKLLDGDVIV